MAEYTIENYSINPETGAFTRVASYITFRGLEFYQRLNGYGQMVINFDLNDPALNPEALTPYRNNLLVKRDNSPVWLGAVSGYDVSYTDVNGSVMLECLEYFSHFDARYTDQSFIRTNTDAGTIVSDLIDAAQDYTYGNLGVVNGTIATVGTTNESLEYGRVSDSIINLSDNLSAPFDFYLEPTLDANKKLDTIRLNVLANRSRVVTDKKVTFDQVLNVDAATQRDVFNVTTGLGFGTGADRITTVISDEGSQSGFTRREQIEAFPSIKLVNTLNGRTEAVNNRTKAFRRDLNLTFLPSGKFNLSNTQLGDILNIDFTQDDVPPLLQIKGTARIIEMNVQVDQEGTEFLTPKLRFI